MDFRDDPHPKLCAEAVHHGRPGFFQCSRNPGHGPGGRYCRQHSRQHEQASATVTLWCRDQAESYGEALPKQVRCIRTTAKTVWLENGGVHPRVSRWSAYYDSEAEALVASLKSLRAKAASARSEARHYDVAAQRIETRMAALKRKPCS
jgi:hypothetical protein